MEQIRITAPAFTDTLSRNSVVTGPKQQFQEVFTRELLATRRVLIALPEEQSEFRPHPRARSARELAWSFSLTQASTAAALTDQWAWPPHFPEAPESYDAVLTSFDATAQAVLHALANTPDTRLFTPIPFMAGPGQTADTRVLDVIWFMLMDAVHHRGQFSVYLRLAGANAPSIYGPPGDEPWS
jgi:uncharacterized damage-inducible protein DinB